MTAGTCEVHHKAKKYIGDGTIDLDNDVFKMKLFTAASNANDLTVDGVAAATNELSGNDYAEQTLANVTWTEVAGVVSFSSDPSEFNASSGNTLTARSAAIYSDTATGKPILCSFELDDTPADVTGDKITATPHTDGWFQLS